MYTRKYLDVGESPNKANRRTSGIVLEDGTLNIIENRINLLSTIASRLIKPTMDINEVLNINLKIPGVKSETDSPVKISEPILEKLQQKKTADGLEKPEKLKKNNIKRNKTIADFSGYEVENLPLFLIKEFDNGNLSNEKNSRDVRLDSETIQPEKEESDNTMIVKAIKIKEKQCKMPNNSYRPQSCWNSQLKKKILNINGNQKQRNIMGKKSSIQDKIRVTDEETPHTFDLTVSTEKPNIKTVGFIDSEKTLEIDPLSHNNPNISNSKPGTKIMSNSTRIFNEKLAQLRIENITANEDRAEDYITDYIFHEKPFFMSLDNFNSNKHKQEEYFESCTINDLSLLIGEIKNRKDKWIEFYYCIEYFFNIARRALKEKRENLIGAENRNRSPVISRFNIADFFQKGSSKNGSHGPNKNSS